MHYALRPWPWIIVALASLVVFPDLTSIQEAFPNVANDKLGHDLAYSAMLTKLPSGLLGLVLVSLIAAYMSTISTHLNWGSSYIVNDFYKQQINPNASEKKLVVVGRISTVALMIISAVLALYMKNAKQVFDFVILFGAGTGLIFILRWFWWRINAWAEIVAMFSSGIISILIGLTPLNDLLFHEETGVFPEWVKFPLIVLITTIAWLSAMYATKPESTSVLRNFYKKIQPGGPGWSKIINDAKSENIEIVDKNEGWSVPSGIIAMLLGCVLIYSCLFATGYWIYGETTLAVSLTVAAITSGYLLKKTWSKISSKIL
jgi:Na+/proline symporter